MLPVTELACSRCSATGNAPSDTYTPYIKISVPEAGDGGSAHDIELDVKRLSWGLENGEFVVVADFSFECGLCSDVIELKRQLDAPKLLVQSIANCPTHGSTLEVRSLELEVEDLDVIPSIASIEVRLTCRECTRSETRAAQLSTGRFDPTAPGVNLHVGSEETILTSLVCDVLIVVATDIELTSLLEAFGQAAASPVRTGSASIFDLGEHASLRVFLARCEAGSYGSSGSAFSISRVLQEVKAGGIVLAGICFGFDREAHELSDLLVSTRLFMYEAQRVGTASAGTSRIVSRGDVVPASPTLLSWFRASVPSWTGSPVRFGTMLSGEKLVDNLEFRQSLQDQAPEAIGGEMEGSGLYAACSNHSVDWIVVKAICDWADGTKSVDKKSRQASAAAEAARYVLHTLVSATQRPSPT